MNETKDVALAGPPSMTPAFSMTPRTFDEAMKFAQLMSESDLVPVGYKGKPGNILVAIQKGVEVGLSPMAKNPARVSSLSASATTTATGATGQSSSGPAGA